MQLPAVHYSIQVLQQTQEKNCPRILNAWAISAGLTPLRQPLEDALDIFFAKGTQRRGPNIAL